jgi:aspartyl-tRNA(Asn)/glutamyl-tRNA(Gln) amidotransferase subunit A
MPEASDLAYADVGTLAAAYRAGRLTPLEVTQASLARLERLEPQLNAVIEPMTERALAAAETATRELAAGRDRGPLHGIPVAIKDLIDIAGVPTTYASRAVDPDLPDQDAVLVQHLREAGAVLLGKTNLLEFAYGIVHPAVGQTNNPFDLERTSGGSSGGSAALVAAGIVPLAVGTDTGGSIRIPAAYCGIVGLKPSFGLVSLDGVFPLSVSLDHAGPLARNIADAAALLRGMTGEPLPLRAVSIAGLRIGVIEAHLQSGVLTPGVRACVEGALRTFAAHGAILEMASIDGLAEANKHLMVVLLPEASLIHENLLAARPQGYATGTRAQIEAGFKISALDYLRAQHLRGHLTEAVEALFDRFDMLLSPAVAWVAPIEDPPLEGEGGDGEMLSSGLANMTGHPALSLPCGLSGGLPVGLQLIGPRGRDAELLSAAAAIEAVLAFSARPAL